MRDSLGQHTEMYVSDGQENMLGPRGGEPAREQTTLMCSENEGKWPVKVQAEES